MRLQVVLLLANAAMALGASACSASQETTHTSRQPVELGEWEWVAPSVPGATLAELHMSLLDDGDVLFSSTYRAGDGSTRTRLATLSGRSKVDESRSDPKARRIVMSDGSKRTVVRSESAKAVLPGGEAVTVIPKVYRQCYRGPVRFILARTGRGGEIEQTKVMFALTDEPRTFVGGGGSAWHGEENASCPNEPPLELTYRVEAASGVFLALPDGTALMRVSGYPIVVRLTRELDSRSKLIGHRLFLLPFESGDDPLYVVKLTGKDYGSIEEGTARYQEALDDLRSYLVKRSDDLRDRSR